MPLVYLIFLTVFAGTAHAICDEYELSRRVGQFYLPLNQAPLVNKGWFSSEAREKLHMWDSEIFYASKIDHLKSKKGVYSFHLERKIKGKDAFTKIELVYGDGTKNISSQKWLCEGGNWLIAAP